MIRVTVAYPKTPDSTFDMDYYQNSHMPMVREKLGDALLDDHVWKGLGSPGDAPAAYEVILHMDFESPEAFEGAFGEHAAEVMGDIPNYTNVRPVVQMDAPA